MMDLVDTARVGLLVLAVWFAASLAIALFWGVAGYRLNRRRELATTALLAAREVSVPAQTRGVPAPSAQPEAAPAIPVHGSKRRTRQDSLKASA
jgi:hypothetical protein